MEEYQIRKLNNFREREVFCLFGIICGINIIKFHKKFFGKIKIIEQEQKVRYLDFDEWCYQSYWTEWKTEWEFKEVKE